MKANTSAVRVEITPGKSLALSSRYRVPSMCHVPTGIPKTKPLLQQFTIPHKQSYAEPCRVVQCQTSLLAVFWLP